MKLAHIVPITMLTAVPRTASAHLTITNLVLSCPRYQRFYRKRAHAGDLVILDNPVHENQPIDIGSWLEAISMLEPTVAIVPDVIDDIPMTVNLARHAAGIVSSRKAILPQPELMAVPHGHTHEEFYQCAAELIKIPGITWLGITLERRLNDDQLALKRRRERLRMLSYDPLFSGTKIHLLGVSETAEELGDDSVWERAVSCDTSKFAVWALTRNPVAPPVPLSTPYPGREIFGGSYNYYWAHGLSWPDRRKFTQNLAEWSRYAQRYDRSTNE